MLYVTELKLNIIIMYTRKHPFIQLSFFGILNAHVYGGI